MRRSGVVTERRRKRGRVKCIRRCALLAFCVLALGAAAMSSDLRTALDGAMERGIEAAAVFADTRTQRVEITLEQKEMYALQLGVYDSGERALSEQRRLSASGVPCVVWQRDKMRIICAVAASRDALAAETAGENEVYIIKDILPEVRLRLSCSEGEAEAAARFVGLPDALLEEMLSGESRTLEAITADTRLLANDALDKHADHLLYAQLAQTLLNWCDLIEATEQSGAKNYAAVTMCTICREWRTALLGYKESDSSTASAQRTPSTAADVIPPA